MSLYPCTFLKTMQQGEGREGVQKKEREKKGYQSMREEQRCLTALNWLPRLLSHHTKQFFLPHSISPMFLLCPKLHFNEVFFTFGAEVRQLHHIDREELHNGEDGSLQTLTGPQTDHTGQHTTAQCLLISSPKLKSSSKQQRHSILHIFPFQTTVSDCLPSHFQDPCLLSSQDMMTIYPNGNLLHSHEQQCIQVKSNMSTTSCVWVPHGGQSRAQEAESLKAPQKSCMASSA